MKSICENVSAGPGKNQSASSRFSQRDPEEGCSQNRWVDGRFIRTDIRLCAKQFLVSPDITAVIVMK
jgi:hypothetical protein